MNRLFRGLRGLGVELIAHKLEKTLKGWTDSETDSTPDEATFTNRIAPLKECTCMPWRKADRFTYSSPPITPSYYTRCAGKGNQRFWVEFSRETIHHRTGEPLSEPKYLIITNEQRADPSDPWNLSLFSNTGYGWRQYVVPKQRVARGKYHTISHRKMVPGLKRLIQKKIAHKCAVGE